MILGKKERVLMKIIYHQASRSPNGKCLLAPLDLLTKIPYKVSFKESELDEILNQLVLDNYFECERAKKPNGDPMYIITLKENGISYLRDKKVAQRKLVFRIIIAALIATFSFSIKYILQAIFG
ncbi:MAG: hypothetical protein EOM87_07165 [Clostridia bacterium]|nr:hypothetical protein [Clostridia bacterium]